MGLVILLIPINVIFESGNFYVLQSSVFFVFLLIFFCLVALSEFLLWFVVVSDFDFVNSYSYFWRGQHSIPVLANHVCQLDTTHEGGIRIVLLRWLHLPCHAYPVSSVYSATFLQHQFCYYYIYNYACFK